MVPVFAWLLAIPLLGFLTGCRSMTPMAVVCWFAYLGDLGLPAHVLREGNGSGSVVHGSGIHGTWCFWAAKLVTVIVFTVLAAGEYIGDKLPNTPNRTAIFPLLARLGFGGLVGAICATSLNGVPIEGALLGALGALVGSFVGYHIRQTLVKDKGFKDLHVALVEDVLVIGLSVLAMGLVSA